MISKIILWIASFLGTILKKVLPALMKQGREARGVVSVGRDKELRDDMKKQFEKELNNDEATD